LLKNGFQKPTETIEGNVTEPFGNLLRACNIVCSADSIEGFESVPGDGKAKGV